ncbi:hypothetical protein [Pseudarcicella hirudinis]|nr:hypothetical protein [Pseudarcicella hirudinis]
MKGINEQNSQTKNTQEFVEGFFYVYKHTLFELKGLFTRGEIIALFDMQNGLMLTPQFQASANIFCSHCQEAEELDGTFSRHGADSAIAIEKIRNLTSSQVFVLQAEIAKFWNLNEGQDLEKAIVPFVSQEN